MRVLAPSRAGLAFWRLPALHAIDMRLQSLGLAIQTAVRDVVVRGRVVHHVCHTRLGSVRVKDVLPNMGLALIPRFHE